MIKITNNLKNLVFNFINIKESDSFTLFSAYIKLPALKEINKEKKIKQIIVRWEVKDLCLGVSDIELHQYCEENNIALYRNTRIHLKVLWDGRERVLFGSSNITERGLGLTENYNYEFNGINDNLS